jgi:2-polyprenyl-3-methyl-5-hydroxy-6-metoxy-1,4-benzoquinol methylase
MSPAAVSSPSCAISCDLCGGSSQELIFNGGDRLYGIAGRFNLVKCQDCGLVFVCPRPPFDEMARFYPQQDYDLYNKAAGLTEKNMEQLGRLHGPRKGRIERYKPGGRLLDIGFGDGSFLYFMKENGWDVAGLDFNEEMVERAAQAGLDARSGQLEEAGYDDRSFDVVTLWGVIEHLQSPRRAVEEISRISAEDALLVVYTQNASAPEASLLGEDWFIYEVPRHLYSFTPETITKLLSAGGFRVTEIVYETPLYYCQMNWQYFKERRLHRKSDVVHDPSIIDRFAVKALSFYKKIVDGRPWSSAMTVYAVKDAAAPCEEEAVSAK